MKKYINYSFAILSSLALVSCGNSAPKEEENTMETSPAVATICTYSYNSGQTNLTWTAYKFTERAGVAGTFDSLSITAKENAAGMQELLKGARFIIPISSINTKNEDRDMKIQKFFFGSMNATTELSGIVMDVEGDNESGSLQLMLTMNELEGPVDMRYLLNGDTLIIEGMIDVNAWNGQTGIERLNQECKQLHTGPDGASVLWPEVKLELRSVLSKTCN